MFKTILTTILLCLSSSLSSSLFAQSIDPTQQINWTLGPIPQMQPALVNGIPQVASWAGSDACAKLHNAMMYALTNSLPLVDASGLTGAQPCASNPFLGLNATNNAPVMLGVDFGAAHFQTVVPWVITNSAIHLRGLGPFSTQVEYTGPTGAAAVMTVNGGAGSGILGSNGINGIEMDGIWFYGDNIAGTPNATDGLLLIFVSRSKFDSVYAWGVSGCGIHTMGAVTDTFIRPRVSSVDATYSGIGTHPQPTNGLCLGGLAGAPGGNEDTTSSNIIDPGMEGLSGVGILLQSADQLHITGGTSEDNVGGGIVVNTSASGVNAGTSNKFNMFNTIDLEGNGPDVTGDDITDNGMDNTYVNILAASPCSSPCTATVNLTGLGSQYFLGGFPKFGIAGGGGSGIYPVGFTATSATSGSASALPGAPAGYIVQQQNGANVKVPFWNF